jgi:aminoglycoside phosphotransferase (APT) family kinase protein
VDFGAVDTPGREGEVSIRRQQVRDLLQTQFAASAEDLVHLSFGHANISFRASISGRDVIVRTNSDAKMFRGTESNLRVLRGLGLPVPEVLAISAAAEETSFAWMILEAFPGRDLRFELAGMSVAQLTTLAAQVMEYERRVSDLPIGTGFGYVPIGQKGPEKKWIDVIWKSESFHAADSVEALRATIVMIDDLVERYRSRLESVRPVCFLDDLTTKNVLIDGGRLSGIVDFDVVCYGDPRFHLGLTTTAVAADVPGQLLYVEMLCRERSLTAADRGLIALYAAMCGVEFLHDQPLGTSWAHRLQALIDGWLATATAAS